MLDMEFMQDADDDDDFDDEPLVPPAINWAQERANEQRARNRQVEEPEASVDDDILPLPIMRW